MTEIPHLQPYTVNTDGGVYIGGNVSSNDGGFVGRDKITYNTIYQTVAKLHPNFKDYIYDFSNTIQNSLQWFVGREFILTEIENFLKMYPCGYFCVVADAGLGKTAIASQLVTKYDSLAHFFNASTGLVYAEDCLNNLCAQLIVRYNLPYDYLPQRSGTNSTLFSRLLQQSAQTLGNGEKLLIVIDALDEAQFQFSGHNWIHLPDQLPNKVYIVVTYRPGDYLLHTLSQTPVKKYGIRWDDKGQQKDIEDYLTIQVERPEIEKIFEKSENLMTQKKLFIETLKRKSQGNFKYLDYVLADIIDYKVDIVKQEFESLPYGLKGYYSQFWSQIEQPKHQEQWNDWRDLYRPIILLLCTAAEPITCEWLAAHTGRDSNEIRERVLLRWQRFLTREISSGNETWRIIHQSFSDFVAERIDLTRTHQQIASWYLSVPSHWKLHNQYAYYHLSSHLLRADQLSEIGNLIEDPDWFAAQRSNDSTLHSYVRDIERAIALAEKDPIRNLSEIIAWSLLYGTLRDRASNIPLSALETLIVLDRAKEAIEYAELINDERGNEERAITYSYIADCLFAHGNIEHAKEILQQALFAAKKLDYGWWRAAAAMSRVALVSLKMDNRSLALELMQSAIGMLENTERSYDLVTGLKFIAEVLMKLGDINNLRKLYAVAKRIKNASERVNALNYVSRAFYQLHEIPIAQEALAESIQAASQIKGWEISWAYSEIVETFFQFGDTQTAQQFLDKALVLLNQLRGTPEYYYAPRAIIHILAIMGEYDHAFTLLDSIENVREIGYSFLDIVKSLIQTGNVSRAVQESKKMHLAGEESQGIWSDIAVILFNAGEIEEGLSIINTLNDPKAKAKAISAIALNFAKAGDIEKAQSTLNNALNIAESIRRLDGYFDCCYISLVAEESLKLGKYELANDMIQYAITKSKKLHHSSDQLWFVRAQLDIAKVLVSMRLPESAGEIVRITLENISKIERLNWQAMVFTEYIKL